MLGLDILQTYLVVVNVFTFILGTIDCRAHAQSNRHVVHPSIALLFTAAGGCVGTLVAALLFDPSMRKDNVAIRFMAVGSLVAWGLALVTIYGAYRLDIEALNHNLSNDHTATLVYLAALNATTLVVFCVDKYRAVRHRWRVPESALLGLSMMGGAIGGMVGMAVAHHKVNTAYFRIGLPLMLALQVMVLIVLVQLGLA